MRLADQLELSVLIAEADNKLQELQERLQEALSSDLQTRMVGNARQALAALSRSLRVVEPVEPPPPDVS